MKLPNIKNNHGFTLIELLIVIVVIVILAAGAFVALDPATRFQDSRDATRWTDATAILDAIKVDQVDNGGSYVSSVAGMTAGEVYMITDGTPATPDCDGANTQCTTNVTAETVAGDHCVDLSALVSEGYLADVPTSPNGSGTWSGDLTGYTLERSSTGAITVRGCEGEGGTEITVSR